MTSMDKIVVESGRTAIGAVVLVAIMVGVGGLISFLLWLSLLPKLAACSSLVGCGLVVVAIGFLAVVCPLLLLWFGRGYVLFKVLYKLYKLHEPGILQLCANQLCVHQKTLATASTFKTYNLTKKLPLPVRLLLRKLDLKPVFNRLKTEPNLEPEVLVPLLKQQVKQQGLIKNPSAGFFWLIMLLMLVVAAGVWVFA